MIRNSKLQFQLLYSNLLGYKTISYLGEVHDLVGYSPLFKARNAFDETSETMCLLRTKGIPSIRKTVLIVNNLKGTNYIIINNQTNRQQERVLKLLCNYLA